MDQLRFDGWTKTFASGISRRQVIRGLTGAVLAAVFWRRAPALAGECGVLGDVCDSDANCCDGFGCHLQSIECIPRGNGTVGLAGLCIDASDCREGLTCDPTGRCREGEGTCSDFGGPCTNHFECCGESLCYDYNSGEPGTCGERSCNPEGKPCTDIDNQLPPCCNGMVCIDDICVAETGEGTPTITVHVATCPPGAGSDLFAQCHDNALPGINFSIGGTAVISDGNGVASADVETGEIVVAQLSAGAGDAYVYCAEQHSGTMLVDGSVDGGTIGVSVAAGDVVVCDWYILNGGVTPDPTVVTTPGSSIGATTLPSTGSGHTGTSRLTIGLGSLAGAMVMLARRIGRHTER